MPFIRGYYSFLSNKRYRKHMTITVPVSSLDKKTIFRESYAYIKALHPKRNDIDFSLYGEILDVLEDNVAPIIDTGNGEFSKYMDSLFTRKSVSVIYTTIKEFKQPKYHYLEVDRQDESSRGTVTFYNFGEFPMADHYLERQIRKIKQIRQIKEDKDKRVFVFPASGGYYSFTLKHGQPLDIKRIEAEVGQSYVLDGRLLTTGGLTMDHSVKNALCYIHYMYSTAKYRRPVLEEVFSLPINIHDKMLMLKHISLYGKSTFKPLIDLYNKVKNANSDTRREEVSS